MNTQTASISLSMASFRFDTLGALMGTGDASSSGAAGAASPFEQLLSQFSSPLSSVGAQGGQPAGRNMSLNDPESAYSMMTDINRFEVNWKAEFAELSEMDDTVETLGSSVQGLGKLSVDDSSEAIIAQLQAFVAQYNGWSERFAPDMKSGGILDHTQAAGVTVHELEASIRNILNGSKDGFSGLGDLGISIDPKTHAMTLDSKAFEAALASNKSGVVGTLKEFAADFSGAADSVTADGKFIERQLDNLDRVLDYLRDNMAAMRLEFGSGDMARTEGQVAKAVQAYEKMVAV
jgi:hypothetical protein